MGHLSKAQTSNYAEFQSSPRHRKTLQITVYSTSVYAVNLIYCDQHSICLFVYGLTPIFRDITTVYIQYKTAINLCRKPEMIKSDFYKPEILHCSVIVMIRNLVTLLGMAEVWCPQEEHSVASSEEQLIFLTIGGILLSSTLYIMSILMVYEIETLLLNQNIYRDGFHRDADVFG